MFVDRMWGSKSTRLMRESHTQAFYYWCRLYRSDTNVNIRSLRHNSPSKCEACDMKIRVVMLQYLPPVLRCMDHFGAAFALQVYQQNWGEQNKLAKYTISLLFSTVSSSYILYYSHPSQLLEYPAYIGDTSAITKSTYMMIPCLASDPPTYSPSHAPYPPQPALASTPTTIPTSISTPSSS